MTILEASQSAIARLIGRRPAAVVSSQDEMEVEITALAQEAATDIAKAQDWQALTEFYPIAADGVSTAYDFPADYDRMVQATDMYDPNNWCWGYTHVVLYGDWIRLQNSHVGLLTPGAWTIRKNQFHFLPAPASGASALFPYISNNIFTSQSGSPKATITRDDDSFVLDERLLTLALIWRWKQMKQMDYAEDMRLYEDALSQEMTRDKGARVIRRNSRRVPSNVHVGWPWILGGET
jgi:hypothetical protein